MKRWNLHISLLLLAAGLLAGACTREPAGQEAGEIRFRVLNEWQDVTKGASIYDGGTMSSGSFAVEAYAGNTTTAYISPTTVSRVSSAWEFADGKHYWPAEGNLSFHAWMPFDPSSYDPPSYITDLTYSYADGPGFSCTLPLTSDDQDLLTEYVYAYAKDRDKSHDGATGVPLNFRHPFATIRFCFAVAHSGIILNRITLGGVKSTGTYTHEGGWTSPGGSGTFEWGTYDQSLNAPYQTGDYLVMPQTIGTQTITVTYTDNRDPEHPASVSRTGTISLPRWEAGTHYLYTILLKTNFTVTVTDLETAQPNVTTDVSVTDLENGGYQDYTRYIIP